MDHAEKDLLKQAFWQAFEEKQSEELAASEPAFRPSAYHLRRVSRILGINVQRETDRRYYLRKRAITLILVAALLLASAVTVYAYREAIFGFIEKVFEDHNEISFEADSDRITTTTIEEVYELGYVPEGYKLTNSLIQERDVTHSFEDGEGHIIEFWQNPLDSNNNLGVDNEHGVVEIKKYADKYVYCYVSERSTVLVWRDSKYSMTLTVIDNLSEEELIKMIENIQVKH